MHLHAGPSAREAVQALARTTPLPLALALAPAADSLQPPEVLALATPERAVLIDAARSPELGALLDALGVLAACGAKAAHLALLRRFGAVPSRWACAQLAAQLLAGGRPVALDLPALCSAADLPVPPNPQAGLAALGTGAQILAALVAQQAKALAAAQMQAVSRLEAAAVAPIAEMQASGMPLAVGAWGTLAASVARAADALKARVCAQLDVTLPTPLPLEAGGHAPLEDAQLRAALARLGHRLPDLRRATLARLPAPLGPDLARYRSLVKLHSTYGRSFLQHVGADGRVHPTFEQLGASTGRMACHAPNLQAMVKGTPHRSCFQAPAGRCFVIADYAGCELRILAEMSQDPVFLAAFRAQVDLHAQVASRLFGQKVSHSERPELRQMAKAVNFGLAYGMGAAGLARTLQVPLPRARALLGDYFRQFPRIGGFLEASAAAALKRGYARTGAGRRLYLDAPHLARDRAQAARIAKNMPIQGTNADIIKGALAALRQALRRIEGALIVNCVHDELVVECPEAAAEAVEAALQASMQAAAARWLPSVPILVDSRTAAAWGPNALDSVSGAW